MKQSLNRVVYISCFFMLLVLGGCGAGKGAGCNCPKFGEVEVSVECS